MCTIHFSTSKDSSGLRGRGSEAEKLAEEPAGKKKGLPRTTTEVSTIQHEPQIDLDALTISKHSPEQGVHPLPDQKGILTTLYMH